MRNYAPITTQLPLECLCCALLRDWRKHEISRRDAADDDAPPMPAHSFPLNQRQTRDAHRFLQRTNITKAIWQVSGAKDMSASAVGRDKTITVSDLMHD